jgi:hypothetical protein
VLERTVHHGSLGPGNASIGNEDVEAAIEVLDDCICGGLNLLGIGNLNPICLGCVQEKKELAFSHGMTHALFRHTLNTVLLGNLGGTLNSFCVGFIPQCHIGTGLSQALGNSETNTGSGTSDDGSLAFERKHAHQARVLGGNGVVMDEKSILDRKGSHCLKKQGQRKERNEI